MSGVVTHPDGAHGMHGGEVDVVALDALCVEGFVDVAQVLDLDGAAEGDECGFGASGEHDACGLA